MEHEGHSQSPASGEILYTYKKDPPSNTAPAPPAGDVQMAFEVALMLLLAACLSQCKHGHTSLEFCVQSCRPHYQHGISKVVSNPSRHADLRCPGMLLLQTPFQMPQIGFWIRCCKTRQDSVRRAIWGAMKPRLLHATHWSTVCCPSATNDQYDVWN